MQQNFVDFVSCNFTEFFKISSNSFFRVSLDAILSAKRSSFFFFLFNLDVFYFLFLSPIMDLLPNN